MELPITRPSMMSYADQLDFNELLGKLKSDRCNGFIRVTSGSLEGHILFKEGNQVAASCDKHSKIEAIEKIKSITADANALIEVFDLKESQLDYLMKVNKAYLINLSSKADNIREEIIKSEYPKTRVETETIKLEDKPEIKPKEVNTSNDPSETAIKETEPAPEINNKEIIKEEPAKSEIEPPVQAKINEGNSEISASKNITKEEHIKTDVDVESGVEEPLITDTYINNPSLEKKEINVVEDNLTEEKPLSEEIEFEKPDTDTENMDRSEIMKKYGLKDVHEEEVETLLESYKGGSLSADDVEKVELTLMNKIKKSILGIPKIKGAEVIVFLDNSSELLGTINIISEYESKGLLSRIMGDSKDIENLTIQIINITQIEIRKSFRGYPEIVDNFEINVEFS